MKTKILVVATAAIVGAGVYMHGGHKPRCLLQLFASSKPTVKAQPSMAVLANQVNDPKEMKKKYHQLLIIDANGREQQCQPK